MDQRPGFAVSNQFGDSAGGECDDRDTGREGFKDDARGVFHGLGRDNQQVDVFIEAGSVFRPAVQRDMRSARGFANAGRIVVRLKHGRAADGEFDLGQIVREKLRRANEIQLTFFRGDTSNDSNGFDARKPIFGLIR